MSGLFRNECLCRCWTEGPRIFTRGLACPPWLSLGGSCAGRPAGAGGLDRHPGLWVRCGAAAPERANRTGKRDISPRLRGRVVIVGHLRRYSPCLTHDPENRYYQPGANHRKMGYSLGVGGCRTGFDPRSRPGAAAGRLARSQAHRTGTHGLFSGKHIVESKWSWAMQSAGRDSAGL